MPTIYGLPSDGSVPAHLAPAVRRDAGETLAAKLDTGVGDAVLAVLGDSTGNAPDEWAYLLVQALATAHPDMRVLYQLWDDTAQAYGAETELQAGSVPGTGVVFRDTFTRTGDLYGSTPDLGPVWGGYTNTPGDWSLDGANAVRTSDATGSEALADGGVPGDVEVRWQGQINTLSGGTSPRLNRTFVKYLDSSNHLFAQVAISQTNGTASFTLFKRIGGTASQIGAAVTAAVTAEQDQAPIDVTVRVEGTAITATVNGTVITGSLTEQEAQTLGPSTRAGIVAGVVPTGSATRMSIFEIEALGAATAAQTLRVFNGSMSGSRLTYQADRLALMLPSAPDLVLISSCHNYGTTEPGTYVDEVETFVEQVLDLHPEAGVAVSSQNPQKAPAANPSGHHRRLAALRPVVLRHGWGYIAAFEAFRAQADKGDSMIAADGVHPVAAGSQLWRDAALRYIDRLTFTP